MSGAAGAVVVGIAALIAGWKIKEKDEKARLEKAYAAGHQAGAVQKENELRPRITNLENKNTQLSNNLSTKERELVSKNNQLASKEQEITALKAEIEKLKPKEKKKE